MFDKVAGSHAGSIVLFGSGALGLRALKGLRSLNIEPVAFTDNSPNLWNRSVYGLKVLPPLEAVQRFSDKAVFVVTIYNGSAVRQQLKEMNCTMVVPFAYLFWRYAETFLPYCALDFPHSIYTEAESVERAFSLWADEKSKQEYVAQLRWRLLLDFDSLPAHRPAHEMYFPTDLISFRNDEVFMDCGSFDGDVVRTFLQLRGDKFRNIIALEPDPDNFRKLRKYVFTLEDGLRSKIILREAAAAAQEGRLRFDSTGTVTSSAGASGKIEVEGLPLCRILPDAEPTYVKMDIEGAEMDALIGARDLIKKCASAWAICLYHQQGHLWQVPLFMQSVSDQYDFFLRRYAEECWELVCYAVPKRRRITNEKG